MGGCPSGSYVESMIHPVQKSISIEDRLDIEDIGELFGIDQT